ncbi:MAG: hypothetical protein WCD00_08060 [Desulfuromonadaceae bacterium]
MDKIYGFIIITVLLLSGCGGGGGGGGTPSVQPTIARVTLATQGTLPTGELSGIGVTLQLPAGVTPALAANGSVDSSVVKASGVLANNADLVIPTYYTPATGTTPGTLVFVLASQPPNGFGIGEFATITLNIAPGATNFSTLNLNSAAGSASPVTDFKVISSSPVDLASSSIVDKASISVTLTVEAI